MKRQDDGDFVFRLPGEIRDDNELHVDTLLLNRSSRVMRENAKKIRAMRKPNADHIVIIIM